MYTIQSNSCERFKENSDETYIHKTWGLFYVTY